MASFKPPAHLTANISAERYAKLRQHIVSEVAEELRVKLTPKIRAQVEQEMKAEVLKDTRRQLEKEVDDAKPSSRERRAFQMFVRNVELDAHAQATIASMKPFTKPRGPLSPPASSSPLRSSGGSGIG